MQYIPVNISLDKQKQPPLYFQAQKAMPYQTNLFRHTEMVLPKKNELANKHCMLTFNIREKGTDYGDKTI